MNRSMKRILLSLLSLQILFGSSFAQTPTSANSGLSVSSIESGSATLSWWGWSGCNYYIQESTDLKSWNYLTTTVSGSSVPIMETGSNAVIRLGVAAPASKGFFRLLIPNGIPDAWELQYFGKLGQNPSSLSPAGDGYTLAQEYQLGRNPVVPSGMSLIPAGNFEMGDALDGESDAPVHTVYVSQFYMDQTLVTYAQWQAVYTWAVAHGYSFDYAGSGKAANHPVQTVDWYDCVKWSNARSEMAGLTPCYTVSGSVYRTGQSAPVCNMSASGYRLPTEAEWEKAARGGLSGLRFPWGNTISESQANYYADPLSLNAGGYSYDVNTYGGYNTAYATGAYPFTSPVGSFAANGYGLYDMAGNVFEWCWDWYGSYGSGAQTDPTGAASGSDRVLRGGRWNNFAGYCRVSGRFTDYPTGSNNGYGFRCVRR